jgi:hypothetical protein
MLSDALADYLSESLESGSEREIDIVDAGGNPVAVKVFE